MRERGLKVATLSDPLGVAVVTSDAHAGLKAAVKAILPGAAWQRCRVHFARNITQRVGSARSKPVNALVSTIFAQTTAQAVRAQYRTVIDGLSASFPEVAAMLEQAEVEQDEEAFHGGIIPSSPQPGPSHRPGCSNSARPRMLGYETAILCRCGRYNRQPARAVAQHFPVRARLAVMITRQNISGLMTWQTSLLSITAATRPA